MKEWRGRKREVIDAERSNDFLIFQRHSEQFKKNLICEQLVIKYSSYSSGLFRKGNGGGGWANMIFIYKSIQIVGWRNP